MVTTRSRSGPIALSDTSAESGGAAGREPRQPEVTSRRRSSAGRRQNDRAEAPQAAEGLVAIPEEQELQTPRTRRSTRAAATPEVPTRRAAGGQGRRAKAGAADGDDEPVGAQQQQQQQEAPVAHDYPVLGHEQGDAGVKGTPQKAAAEQNLPTQESQDLEEQQQQQQVADGHHSEQDEGQDGERDGEQDGKQDGGQDGEQHQMEPEHEQHHDHQQQQREQLLQQSPMDLALADTHRTHQGSDHVSEGSSSGSDVSDSDLDLDDEGVVGQLAASIRQALSSRAGGSSSRSGAQQVKQKEAHKQRQQESAADASGPALPHWQPTTGLQLPVAAAKAGLGIGEVVGGRLPCTLQEAADAGGGMGEAAAEGQNCDVGQAGSLAKSLYAPTLDPVKAGKEAKKVAPDTAGKKWYDLPATQITDEMKRDLRLLRLRGAYDPKRFYKSFDDTKLPKYFQMGTVVDDPLDYYGGRLTQQERKATLTEQLLADTDLTHLRKKRYGKLQEEAQKHVKVKKRKTEQPRNKPSKHRPKH